MKSLENPEIPQNIIKQELGVSSNLPLVSYEEIQTQLDEKDPREFKFYEKTSGSTGRVKWIPYTEGLLTSFNFMFRVWCYDLRKYLKNLGYKSVFISLSPPVQKLDIAPNGLSTSIKQDSDYLKGVLSWVFKYFTIGPQKNSLSTEDFLKNLVDELYKAKNLQVISIWSPTYFLTIMEHIESIYGVQNWQKLWPKLCLISCWDSACAKKSANKIRELFPHVIIQGKGLLATEAPITLPIISANGYLPLVTEVFYEFLDDQNNLLQLQQLKLGQQYEVVISQKGGLKRYKIGDLLRVTGFFKKTPMLEFVGRRGEITDMVGEKLSLLAVKELLGAELKSIDFLIVPSVKERRYYMFTENLNLNLNLNLDKKLTEIFHYAQARELGQLQAAIMVPMIGMRKRINEFYLQKGMRLGDIKEVEWIKSPEVGDEFLKDVLS